MQSRRNKHSWCLLCSAHTAGKCSGLCCRAAPRALGGTGQHTPCSWARVPHPSCVGNQRAVRGCLIVVRVTGVISQRDLCDWFSGLAEMCWLPQLHYLEGAGASSHCLLWLLQTVRGPRGLSCFKYLHKVRQMECKPLAEQN